MATISLSYNSVGNDQADFEGYQELLRIPFGRGYDTESLLDQFIKVTYNKSSESRNMFIYKNPVTFSGGIPLTIPGGYSRDGVIKSNESLNYKYTFKAFLCFSPGILAQTYFNNLSMESACKSANTSLPELGIVDTYNGDPIPYPGWSKDGSFGIATGKTDKRSQFDLSPGSNYYGNLFDSNAQEFFSTTPDDMGYSDELSDLKNLFVPVSDGWQCSYIVEGNSVESNLVNNKDNHAFWLWTPFCYSYLDNYNAEQQGIGDITKNIGKAMFYASCYKSEIVVYAGTSFVGYPDFLNVLIRPWIFTYFVCQTQFSTDSLQIPYYSNVTSGNKYMGAYLLVGVEKV